MENIKLKNKLQTPLTIGKLTLKNRIAMAPMTRCRSDVSREANRLMAEYYSQRASAGLIISEATVVTGKGVGYLNTPGIYTEKQAESWKTVTEAVHEKGGIIFLQLWHCGRASHSLLLEGEYPVCSSAVRLAGDQIHTPRGRKDYEVPRALESGEIPGIVEDFRKGAAFAKVAGFDGVEIHGANGYLIDQFLQSKINHRTDEYGGSIENRYRFLDEIVRAVLLEWDSTCTGVRLSPNGVFNDCGSMDFREQYLYVAGQLEKYSLGYLHVMDGQGFGFHGLGEAMTLKEFRQVYSGVLMGNCGYDQASAEEVVGTGEADLISFGRPFISNPDLAERFAQNRVLNEAAPQNVLYSPGEQGYTDFPFYQTE